MYIVEYDSMGQSSKNDKEILWKIVPIPYAPPTQQNWEIVDEKQWLCNQSDVNPDLFEP